MKKEGYTLIELIVVLAIINTILLGSYYSAKSIKSYSLRNDAVQIKNYIVQILVKSININQSQSITFKDNFMVINGEIYKNLTRKIVRKLSSADNEKILISPRGVVSPFSIVTFNSSGKCTIKCGIQGKITVSCKSNI
jgi:prepilin-type N-terminal cleavage/methylation domain-containing protein